MARKRVFIDMDGVICEYKEGALMEDLERKGYFLNLLPRIEMVEAINYLIESDKAEVFVLSAVLPQIENEAKAEKNAWLDRYLPAIDEGHRIFTICGNSKVDAISDFSREDILLDDYSENLFSWHNAGGRAIKILNEINGKNGRFTAGPRIRVKNKTDLITNLALS